MQRKVVANSEKKKKQVDKRRKNNSAQKMIMTKKPLRSPSVCSENSAEADLADYISSRQDDHRRVSPRRAGA